MENKSREKLLEVKNLSQYFKVSRKKRTKAVNHISFDVYKGEVFGIVGESGCGKTTTGRTIIKLYDATSGDVYFKGVRIVAGIFDYKENIKKLKIKYYQDCQKLKKEYWLKSTFAENEIINIEKNYNDKVNSLTKKKLFEKLFYKFKYQNLKNKEIRQIIKKANKNELLIKDYKKEYHIKIQHLKEKRDQDIKKELEKIKKANYDNQNFEKEYYQKEVDTIKNKYQNDSNQEKEELSKINREKLMTKMQMIFQDPISSLDPRMTVREIIAEGLKVIGITEKEEVDRLVYEVLEKVGLVHEHASRYPHEFSGGQRQRIGIARAIIMNPELIIADEPVSALDVSIQAQVINILNDLRKEMDLTIIFIAHDLSVVKYFSDRIAVMYYGEIIELATSNELFAHPLHPYTKSLLSAIPLPDPIYEKKRKRIPYNRLTAHNYLYDKPVLKEILPGHFVSCNEEEFNKYQKELENE